ncbi:MAG: mechanosensitive ion channel family protein, partial [Sneathiella sp.]
MENVDQNLESLTEWVDLIIEFSVTYGFQILGALAFFAFGFIVVNWIGNRLQKIALAKGTDLTLSQFIGST